MTDQLTCGCCGYTDDFDAFDVVGACPDNVFCNQCNSEIDATSGEAGALCGKCDWCEALALQSSHPVQRELFDES